MRTLTYGKKSTGCGAKATCDDGPGRIIVRGIDDEFDEFVGGVADVVAAGGVGKASRRVALTVVDASVVIAVLDPNDVHHATASAAIRDARRQRGSSVLSPASAYARVLVHPARSGRSALALVRRFCSEQLTVEPLSAEMAEAAARLRARHKGLRLPDALVMPLAEVLRADRVLTADRRWSACSRKVEIVRPGPPQPR